jgi:hypothetical protein
MGLNASARSWVRAERRILDDRVARLILVEQCTRTVFVRADFYLQYFLMDPGGPPFAYPLFSLLASDTHAKGAFNKKGHPLNQIDAFDWLS